MSKAQTRDDAHAHRVRTGSAITSRLPTSLLCYVSSFLSLRSHHSLASVSRVLNRVSLMAASSPVSITIDLRVFSRLPPELPVSLLRLRPVIFGRTDDRLRYTAALVAQLVRMTSLVHLTLRLDPSVESLECLSSLPSLRSFTCPNIACARPQLVCSLSSLSSLESLHLDSIPQSERCIASLPASITNLSMVNRNDSGEPEGWRLLLQRHQLRSLGLELAPEGVELSEFATSLTNLTRLEVGAIWGSDMSPLGSMPLLRSFWCGSLKDPIRARLSTLTQLTELETCSGCPFADVEAIQQLMPLTRLTSLTLRYSGLTDEGLVKLAELVAPGLRVLDLRGCRQLTNVSSLSRSVFASRLESLDVKFCQIARLESLPSALDALESLVQDSLTNNSRIPIPDIVATLHRMYPKVKLSS